MRIKDRVAVGWIDGGTVDGRFATDMLNLFTARSSKVSTVIRIEGSLLSRQRNELVASFLGGTGDWLLILDTDESISLEAFDRLIEAAHDVERPVVAGVYFAAWRSEGIYPQPLPMIFRRNSTGRYNPVLDFPENAVIPIDAAGTGCLLIHRSVLERIRTASNEGPLGQHEAGMWCWFRDMPVAGDWFGEDMFFCARVRELGYPIVAATGARLGHHKDYWLTDAHYEGALMDALAALQRMRSRAEAAEEDTSDIDAEIEALTGRVGRHQERVVDTRPVERR